MPSVSVCLPVFNGETYLERAIESVLDQTYSDFELVVVDDFSFDTTRAIMDRFARADNRVKCYANSENLGLFANYNECIKRSQGEFVKLFAQDDLLAPGHIEWAVEALREYPSASLVATARNWVDHSGADVSDSYGTAESIAYFEPPGPVRGLEVISKSLIPLVNFIGEPACVTLRRTALGTGFDPRFNHLGDLDYWFQVLLHGDYVFTPEALASFRRHRTNRTVENLNQLKVATDVLKIGQKYTGVIADCGLTNRQYMRHAVQVIAAQLYVLTRSGDGITTNSKSEEILQVKADLDEEAYIMHSRQLLSRLSPEELRDITAYALELLVDGGVENRLDSSGYLAKTPSRYIDKNILVNRYESRLERLLRDPFWCATEPLRIWNRFFSTKVILEDRAARGEDETELLKDQEAYLKLLKSTIASIKTSRSWAIKRYLTNPGSINMLWMIKPSNSVLLKKRAVTAKEGESVKVSWDPLSELIESVIYDYEVDTNLARNGTEKKFAEVDTSISPKLSILVNIEVNCRFHQIVEAFDSQSVDNSLFEVIFLDSTSSANNISEIREFSMDKKPTCRLRVVQTRKGGRALAHNVGLRLALGEVIVLLASDFVPGELFIEKHLEFHRRHSGESMIAVGGALFPEELRNTSFRRWLDDAGAVFGVCFSEENPVIPPNFFYAGNASFKKSFAFEAGLFDEDFLHDAFDDYEMGLRWSRKGIKSIYIPEAMCMHHHNVTLGERMKVMKRSAAAALTVDRKHGGRQPWHSLVAQPAWMPALRAISHFSGYIFSRKNDNLYGAYRNLLDACFVRNYRNLQKLPERNS